MENFVLIIYPSVSSTSKLFSIFLPLYLGSLSENRMHAPFKLMFLVKIKYYNTTCTYKMCQCNSSTTAEQNFLKLCDGSSYRFACLQKLLIWFFLEGWSGVGGGREFKFLCVVLILSVQLLCSLETSQLNFKVKRNLSSAWFPYFLVAITLAFINFDWQLEIPYS